MTGYRARVETEKYGKVVVPICENCLPEGASIRGHISDDRHYEEGGVEQPSCYYCNKYL